MANNIKYFTDSRPIAECALLGIYGNASSGSTEFGLSGQALNGGDTGDGFELAVYSSVANLIAAVTAFVNTVDGWVMIGDPTDDFASASPQNQNYFGLGVQLSQLASMSDAGTGISFNGVYYPTFGYAPFANFAAAEAVLMPLAGGTYDFTGY